MRVSLPPPDANVGKELNAESTGRVYRVEMDERRLPPTIVRAVGLATLGVVLMAVPAPAFVQIPRLAELAGAPAAEPDATLEELLARLDGFDRDHVEALEARYRSEGNEERRVLERRFGLIEHRFRVSADPREIYRNLDHPRRSGADRVRLLREITRGDYSAYYFFDAVIRPNVFAPERYLGRTETPIHEKVHLIQPSLFEALGIRCVWLDPGDGCVRSIEPVAVYLTEYAMLARAAASRGDARANAMIARYLDFEARRCATGPPARRCPRRSQVEEYILLPRELARRVERHGLEEGIRRFVAEVGEGGALALGR